MARIVFGLLTVAALGRSSIDAVASEKVDQLISLQLHRQQVPLHNIGGIVHHKSAYFGQISVGTSAVDQVFDIVFDTGSGHLVLPSTYCRAETCRKHQRYRRKASSTARDINVDGALVAAGAARDQITVSYGTGEITGIFMQDVVCMRAAPSQEPSNQGQAQGSALLQRSGELQRVKVPPNAEAQAPVSATAVSPMDRSEDSSNSSIPHGCIDLRFIAATQMSEEPFSSFDFDGILGLGLASLSQSPEYNLVEALAAALGGTRQLEESSETMQDSNTDLRRAFAVFLGVSPEERSEITFGGFRKEHLLPPREGAVVDDDGLAWSQVQEPELGYWQIDIYGIIAGGKALDFCTREEPCRAVVDTGTSLLAVPSKLLPVMVDELRHPAASEGGCQGPGPVLELDLGNLKVTLDPKDYARPEQVPEAPDSEDAHGEDDRSRADGELPAQQAPTDSEPNLAGDLVEGEEHFCVPMMMEIDLQAPLSPKTLILGEPVLQRYYAIFDAGAQPRVGFGEARHTSAEAAELRL